MVELSSESKERCDNGVCDASVIAAKIAVLVNSDNALKRFKGLKVIANHVMREVVLEII